MPVEMQGKITNNLINNLPLKERDNVLLHCEKIELRSGEILYQKNIQIKYVYFPETSIITLVTILTGHAPLGIALIGNESMLGATLVLGNKLISMRDALVQNSGTALRMKASHFQKKLLDYPILSFKLNDYLSSQINRIFQSSGCAQFHEIQQRLACWLLMTLDRSHSVSFHLTHGLLSEMLGVRRSSITVAAGALQKRKLIVYNRGDIKVLNRKGLELAACQCYCSIE